MNSVRDRFIFSSVYNSLFDYSCDLFCKSCEPEIVFVLLCILAKQFHGRKSYETRESTLLYIGKFWRKYRSLSYLFSCTWCFLTSMNVISAKWALEEEEEKKSCLPASSFERINIVQKIWNMPGLYHSFE